MRNLYLVTVVATVWLGACTTDGGLSIQCTINGETKEFVTSPGRENCDQIRATGGENPTTVASDPLTAPATTESPIFAAPVVSRPTAGFLEPTNKTERQEKISAQVGGTERDPFITIPGSVPLPPAPPAPPSARRIVRRTTSQIRVKPVEPPSTTEASAVLVSGLLDIGGSKYAIINAPGEPTSRPISVGQSFINGTVLFKRVQNISGDTFVILEQNGVEVPRPIGNQATPAASPKIS